MAWLPGVPDDEIPDSLAQMADGQRRAYGSVLNSLRQSARIPEVALGMSEMGKALSRSHKVEPRLSRLLNLRVAAIVGCPL